MDESKISPEVSAKYSFDKNTFIGVAKPDPKDKIDIEIGDSKQPDFKPQVKIMRWDNETNLSFRLKDDGLEKETVTTDKDKIIWSKGTREAHFYDFTNAEHPEGASEFEIILKEKPATNVVEFTLNTKGLDFFYQTELTQEEKDGGASRPDNVIGSYAVYASEQKTNYVGGKEYKTGKVGHIYRPQVEDSKGTKVWGDLNVNTETGILSVTIPQDFLDNAVYPVRHAAGLTFGYTSVGGSSGSTNSNRIRANNSESASEAGTVSKLTARLSILGGTPSAKGVIALTSDHVLLTNGVSSATAVTEGSGTWKDLNFSTEPSITATNYTIGVIFNGAVLVYYDTVSNASWFDDSNSYTTPTNPTDGYLWTFRISIYATYTAGGAPTPNSNFLMFMR